MLMNCFFMDMHNYHISILCISLLQGITVCEIVATVFYHIRDNYSISDSILVDNKQYFCTNNKYW